MSEHQLWNELGNIYLNTGSYPEAISAYGKAIELEPGFGWAYSNMAMAYDRLGKFKKAIPNYQRSIELLEDFREKAVSWHRMGCTYRAMEDLKSAKVAFERAIALDPENARYQADLEQILAGISPVAEAPVQETPVDAIEGTVVSEVEEQPEPVQAVVEALIPDAAPEVIAEEISEVEELTEEPQVVLEEETFELAPEAIAEETSVVEEPLEELQPEPVLAAVEENAEEIKPEAGEKPFENKESNEFANWLDRLLGNLGKSNIARNPAFLQDQPVELPEGIDAETLVAELSAAVESRQDWQSADELVATEEEIAEEAAELVLAPETELEPELIADIEIEEEPVPDASEVIEEPVVVEEPEPAEEDVETHLGDDDDDMPLSLDDFIAGLAKEMVSTSPDVIVAEEPLAETDELPVVESELIETSDLPILEQLAIEEPVLVEAENSAKSVEAEPVSLFSASDDLAVEPTLSVPVEPELAAEEQPVVEPELAAEAPEIPASVPELDPLMQIIHENGGGNGHNGSRLSAGNALVWGELGNLFFKAGALDEAIMAYSKALEVDATCGKAMHNLALTFIRKGQYGDAIAYYQKSIEHLPNPQEQATSWNSLGNTYRIMNQYDQAANAYRMADELDQQRTNLQNWVQFGLMNNTRAQ